jgi:hypothetical protein
MTGHGRLPVNTTAARMTARVPSADIQSQGLPIFAVTHKPLMMRFHLSTTGRGAIVVGSLSFASEIARKDSLDRAISVQKFMGSTVRRQRPRMPLSPANPHECSRIASKFTVRPDFGVTVRRGRRLGVEF